MTDYFRTPEDYELFIYTLSEQFVSIRRSTVTFVRRGATLARVTGELFFDQDIRLTVRERLVYSPISLHLDEYGYEVWRGNEKLYWYDSQPHPNNPDLQSTHPHHKHVPPDIKHHRIPAPQMSFAQPNFSALINEIEKLINDLERVFL